jgi:hypothetical protein
MTGLVSTVATCPGSWISSWIEINIKVAGPPRKQASLQPLTSTAMAGTQAEEQSTPHGRQV